MENKEEQELKRCIGCKVSPCAKNCPLGVSPHDFIALALQGDFEKSASLIRSKNPMAETCGYICPDTFCQKSCIRGKIDSPIDIPYLQTKITQKIPPHQIPLPPNNGKQVAIVGGGPSSLGACWQLLQYGYKVTIFEKEDKLGGAIRLIPDYRLPKSVLDKEISYITNNPHTTIHLNHEITDFQTLTQDFDHVILALGEQTPHTLRTQGEELATPYKQVLTNPSNFCCQKACVVGGGEVALDCALSLKKQGVKEVEMFVRRRKTDMRIMKRDFEDLSNNGIIIRELTSITQITQTPLQTLTLQTVNNYITEDNKSAPLKGTENTLENYNLVVTALGSTCRFDNTQHNLPTIGDMTKNCGTVVQALASGIKLAQSLHNK